MKRIPMGMQRSYNTVKDPLLLSLKLSFLDISKYVLLLPVVLKSLDLRSL